MNAVVKYGNNYGELELRDVPVPAVGDEDILIKVKAAGICGSDLLFYAGQPLPIPSVIGHEFAGTIEAVGKNVTSWSVGDRIVSDNTGYACGKCYSCSTGQYLECEHRIGIGYGYDGGFAEYVRIPGDILKLNPNCVFRIPEELSYETASLLDPCANAYHALLQKASFTAGDDVVIYGPGTIGLICVQVAKAAGAHKIVLMGLPQSSERLNIGKELGATHTVISTDTDAIEQVKAILGGESPRIIVDCAGSPAVLNQALAMVANGGEIVKIGFDHKPFSGDLNTLVLKAAKIIGNMGYDYVSWRNCIKLLVDGSIKSDKIITHRLPMDEFHKGFDLLFKQEAIKVILTP